MSSKDVQQVLAQNNLYNCNSRNNVKLQILCYWEGMICENYINQGIGIHNFRPYHYFKQRPAVTRNLVGICWQAVFNLKIHTYIHIFLTKCVFSYCRTY